MEFSEIEVRSQETNSRVLIRLNCGKALVMILSIEQFLNETNSIMIPEKAFGAISFIEEDSILIARAEEKVFLAKTGIFETLLIVISMSGISLNTEGLKEA